MDYLPRKEFDDFIQSVSKMADVQKTLLQLFQNMQREIEEIKTVINQLKNENDHQ